VSSQRAKPISATAGLSKYSDFGASAMCFLAFCSGRHTRQWSQHLSASTRQITSGELYSAATLQNDFPAHD
jgi:hypothetical protein